jgi:hypothetical protein
MADVREKLVFGAIGRLRGVFCTTQSLFGLFELTDVRAGAKPLEDAIVVVSNRKSARLEPEILTIMTSNAIFQVIGFQPTDGFQPDAPCAFAIIGMQGFQPGPAQQFGLGLARMLRPLSAEVVTGAIWRGSPDKLRQCLGQTAPALLTDPQRFLRLPSSGDIFS